MKKYCSVLLLAILTSTVLPAQPPTITNCENFPIGTVTKFQQCNPIGVLPGSGGAAVTWDYTTLSSLPDTSTQQIVSPASTSHGSLFPGSNLVEKNSDGTFAYVYKNTDSSYLVGFEDTVNGYTIHYPNYLLFLVRPVTYGTNVSDTFTDGFASSTLNFNGYGTVSIVGDGYGTLKLPIGTFSNTLRVKVTQVEYDTSLPGTTYVTTSTSYIWFDNTHASCLLKINSTATSTTTSKTVEYLLEEPSGVQQIDESPQFSFFPNPAKDVLHILPCREGVVSVVNMLGQTIMTFAVGKNELNIPVADLPAGIFYIVYGTEKCSLTSRLIITN